MSLSNPYVGLVVFGPLKMEHKIQYVRVLDHEDGPPERWLVTPDNARGASGDVEPYWIEHPWKVVDDIEEESSDDVH